MKKFLLSVAAMAVLGAAAHAADKKSGGSSNGNNGPKPVEIHNNTNNNNQNINNVHNNVKVLPSNLNGFQGQNGNQKFQPQVLNPKVTTTNYHLTNGVKKNFGYCYNGFNHNHWSHSCWVPHYGCNCYWCPCATAWYYWCAFDGCWYPVSYCPYGKYVF